VTSIAAWSDNWQRTWTPNFDVHTTSRILLHTETTTGGQSYQVAKLILATGDLHRPRRLEIPGEDLPHVSHYFV